MKTEQQIRDLDIEELEALASDLPVPQGLTARIEASLAAAHQASQQDAPPYRLHRMPLVVATALAAVAVVIVTLLPGHGTPQDTFDDPALAYAEVEQTLRYISECMAQGVDIFMEARPVTERPHEILDSALK